MSTNVIDVHIENLPSSIREIYKALRAVAKRSMPGVHEIYYHHSLGYGTSESPFDRVVYIAHQPKGYINFGFFYGAGLPDPEGLIDGAGKRMRHVKIYTMEDAQNPALAKLAAVAWKKAEQDVSTWRQSLKKKK